MASSQENSSSFGPDFYLNPQEHSLLINALNSNMPSLNGTNGTSKGRPSSLYGLDQRPGSNPQRPQSTESPLFSPRTQQAPLSAALTDSGFEGSPFLDGELDDSNLDWGLGGDLIGDLPGASASPPETEGEHGDKRKSPEDGEDEDGGGKRHENEAKTSKKPGRKPLTSEPTSVSVVVQIQVWRT